MSENTGRRQKASGREPLIAEPVLVAPSSPRSVLYHRADESGRQPACPARTNRAGQRLDRADAEAAGLRPCPDCFPEVEE